MWKKFRQRMMDKGTDINNDSYDWLGQQDKLKKHLKTQ